MRDPKMVWVKISGTAEVRYNQTVQMEEKTFYELEDMLAEEEERAGELIRDYLNLHDIDDGEPLEVDTFKIVRKDK